MRQVLLFVAAVIVIVVGGWFLAWRYYASKEAKAGHLAWAGLGSVDSVPQRFPMTKQSEGATKLVGLASLVHVNLEPRSRTSAPKPFAEAITGYLQAQFERGGDAIDAPPPLVAAYLADNEKRLDAIRDHLLSGAPVVWETDVRQAFEAPIPNLIGHMQLHKILAVRALDKARRNDPAAWNDLRASWELNRGLWKRPDLISILIALATTRMSNAAARKMPLPAPAWLDETFDFDYLHAMAASQQAEAWTIQHATPGKRSVGDIVRAPWYAQQGKDALNTFRTYTDAAVRAKACDAESSQFATARAAMTKTSHMAMPNLFGAWQRLMRFRAELESTERVLQIRAGQTPSPGSQCSDGTWQVTANSIRFSKDVKVPPPGIKFPLEYVR